ncbi:hypothetical protein HK097_002980 [Rhizophlyctis rosea]|uniref:Cation efflux protein n=1 Tax=Rhizophlyctis rosea TaxID=64517 RepID=A0AAD5SG47_9FUNG|nr:hypothetical protein HK097_002980 [Rhizophlyctis rosea]
MALKKTTRLVLLGAMLGAFMVVELTFGYISNSLALIADSFHMLSDVLSVIVGWYAIKLASRSAVNTNKYTYGWQRAEVLGALINGVFLLALTFIIMVEAIQRFVEPSEVENPWMVLYVGIVGLAINLIGLLLFHEHGHSHGHSHGGHAHGKSKTSGTSIPTESALSPSDIEEIPALPLEQRAGIIQIATIIQDSDSDLPSSATSQRPSHAKKHDHGSSLNMRGVFLHVLGDALGSVGVIISALCLIFVPNHPRWTIYVDPICSVAIALIILTSTIPLVKSASYILLQTVPISVSIDRVREDICRVPGVAGVHELHVWQLSETKTVATVHVLMAGSIRGEDGEEHPVDYMTVTANVKKLLHGYGIHSSTIQPEHVDEGVHLVGTSGRRRSTTPGTSAEGDEVVSIRWCVAFLAYWTAY